MGGGGGGGRLNARFGTRLDLPSTADPEVFTRCAGEQEQLASRHPALGAERDNPAEEQQEQQEQQEERSAIDDGKRRLETETAPIYSSLSLSV
jgi:hypothetical protein